MRLISVLGKQHAQGALVITRFRCSLAVQTGKLMRFAPSNSLILIKFADSE